jgi:hypothetical protein
VLGLPPAFNLSHDQTLQFKSSWFWSLYGDQPALLTTLDEMSSAEHKNKTSTNNTHTFYFQQTFKEHRHSTSSVGG